MMNIFEEIQRKMGSEPISSEQQSLQDILGFRCDEDRLYLSERSEERVNGYLYKSEIDFDIDDKSARISINRDKTKMQGIAIKESFLAKILLSIVVQVNFSQLNISYNSINQLQKLLLDDSTFSSAMKILINFQNAILNEKAVIKAFEKINQSSLLLGYIHKDSKRKELAKKAQFDFILKKIISEFSFIQFENRKNEEGILDTIFAETWSDTTLNVDAAPSEIMENLTVKSLQLLANSDNSDFSTLLTTLLMAGKKQTINAAVFHMKKIKEFLNS